MNYQYYQNIKLMSMAEPRPTVEVAVVLSFGCSMPFIAPRYISVMICGRLIMEGILCCYFAYYFGCVGWGTDMSSLFLL